MINKLTKDIGEIKKQLEKLSTYPDNIFKQLESLMNLFFSLSPTFPIPSTRGGAVSPDLLHKISETIFLKQPHFILEASSGVSTLIIAYTLQKIGKGKVLSFEHDEIYAEKTREMLNLHCLSDFAEVVFAPLVKFSINGTQWLWYDFKRANFQQKQVDIFVIDGPPAGTQKLARYPALPLLYEYMSKNSLIILDDYQRTDEREIVKKWLAEYPNFDKEVFPFEKGAVFLSRKASRLTY